MERRHFLVAAAIGSLAGPAPALAQATGSPVGRMALRWDRTNLIERVRALARG